MHDRHGRHITYLRVSVTDRCDLRCRYCMGPDHQFVPRDEVLTLEELERVCRVFVALGVRKIRITGGEPLVRRDVLQLFRGLGGLITEGSLAELTLTTNGTQLARHARELSACGVQRVNVSLDSIDRQRFQAITGRDALHDVLGGIAAARAAGLRVKINAVVTGTDMEDEIHRLIEWCGQLGHDLTLIEAMPLGRHGHAGTAAPSLQMLRHRLQERWTLLPLAETTGGPARYVRVVETGGRLGFITPLSGNFCDSCNRVRLTCEGQLRLCLGRGEAIDLRHRVRSGCDDETLRAVILDAIGGKPDAHRFGTGVEEPALMNRIGG